MKLKPHATLILATTTLFLVLTQKLIIAQISPADIPTSLQESDVSGASKAPLRATVVGRNLVYQVKSSVSLDAKTGLFT